VADGSDSSADEVSFLPTKNDTPDGGGFGRVAPDLEAVGALAHVALLDAESAVVHTVEHTVLKS
jgi:hypothetical protein